jgi:hypothetical protein
MSRKSSIHFKPVSNIRFAVSHSERTDLSEPAYLLPKEHQLANILIPDSLPENDLAALFIQQQTGMSRQAKTAGSSPFWEGVVVLPNTNGPEQTTNLMAWKKEYEATTGHKVLHMSIHLDEGYLDTAGVPQYNPHAHVIVSRMDSKNRVIHLDRKQLAGVQDLTAKTLHMERGSTLEERKGHRGRTHIEHREFRKLADEKRVQLDVEKAETARIQKISQKWSDDDLAKIKDLKKELAEAKSEAGKVPDLEATVATQAEQIIQINERSRLEREALKASGTATQKDYQDLKKSKDEEIAQTKKTHEAELAVLKIELARATQQAVKVPSLEAQVVQANAQIEQLKPLAQQVPELKTQLAEVPNLVAMVASQADQITQLQEKYRLDREEFKRLNAEAAAAGLAKVKSQKDYQDLKTTHLGDVAEIGKAHAKQVEDLKTKLTEALTEAKKVPDLEAQATGLQAQIAQLKPLAEQVPVLVAQAERVGQMTEMKTKLARTVSDGKDQVIAQLTDENTKLKASKAPQQPPQSPQKPTEAQKTGLSTQNIPEALKSPLATPVVQSIQPTREAAAPGPSLAERVAASWAGFVGWIKSLGAEQEPVGENTLHIGPVVHLDDFHAVQKTGRRYAVHVLDTLDRVPDTDNPRMEIQYRGGVGVVKGNSPARHFPRQR